MAHTQEHPYYEDEGVDREEGLIPTPKSIPSSRFSSITPEYQPTRTFFRSTDSRDAPYIRQEEEGLFNKIARGFQNMAASGTGQLPFYLQVQLAKDEADIKQREIKVREANVIHSMLTFEKEKRKQDADMYLNAMEALPNAKAQILTSKEEDRAAITKLWADRLNSMSPGVGDIVAKFGGDPSLGLTIDMVTEQSKDLQALYQTTTPEKYYSDPRFLAAKERLGRDSFNMVTSRFDYPEQLKSAKKDGLSEEEFRTLFKKTAIEMNIPPRTQAFANEFLSTPTGQQLMQEQGVKLAHVTAKEQETEAGKPYEERVRNTELRQIEERLKELEPVRKELENYIPKGEVDKIGEEYNKLMERREILLKLPGRVKIGAGESLAKNTAAALFEVSGGKYNSNEDLAASGLPLPEQASLMKQALERVGRIYAEGKISAAQQGPFPVGKEEVYAVSDLVQGKLERYLGPLSTNQAVSSGKYVSLDKDQIKGMQSLVEAKGTSLILFDMAKKIFTAKGQVEVGKQVTWYYTIGYLSTEAKTYRDIITGWSTIYARALGREVGVLTDRDVNRWVSIMPMPSDSVDVVRRKEEVMDKFITFLTGTTAKVIAGKLPHNLAFEKGKHRDTVDGYLGSLEKIHEGAGKSESGKDRGMSKAEQLRKEMLEGK